jgi:hypothetical protein
MKVISALLHEPFHVPNLGTVNAQLPGPKFPNMTMTYVNRGVILEVKGKVFLVPETNFKYIELERISD